MAIIDTLIGKLLTRGTLTLVTADGKRTAHGVAPNTAALDAIAQYTSGGLVQCATSSLRCGVNQSPLASMCKATLV